MLCCCWKSSFVVEKMFCSYSPPSSSSASPLSFFLLFCILHHSSLYRGKKKCWNYFSLPRWSSNRIMLLILSCLFPLFLSLANIIFWVPEIIHRSRSVSSAGSESRWNPWTCSKAGVVWYDDEFFSVRNDIFSGLSTFSCVFCKHRYVLVFAS